MQTHSGSIDDKSRLKKKIGEVPVNERSDIIDILDLMFQPD